MTPAAAKKRIVKGLAEFSLGKLLVDDKELPERSEIMGWIRTDVEFAGACMEATRDRAEMLLERHQDELMGADGKTFKAAEAKIRHLQWYLERLNPLIYGRRGKSVDVGEGIAALLAEARKRAGFIEGVVVKELPKRVQ